MIPSGSGRAEAGDIKKAMEFIQEEVDASIGAAIANGYPQYELDPYVIAVDMCDKDASFEGVDAEQLLPFIDNWKMRNKPEGLPRTPDGWINNCSLYHGDPEETCQICGGDCPDRALLKKQGR